MKTNLETFVKETEQHNRMKRFCDWYLKMGGNYLTADELDLVYPKFAVASQFRINDIEVEF